MACGISTAMGQGLQAPHVGCPAALLAADLDENNQGRQNLLRRELLISAQAGEQPGDALICVFGSHRPMGNRSESVTVQQLMKALQL